MSIYDHIGGKQKHAAKAYRKQLRAVCGRVDAFVDSDVDERTRHTLAQCLILEENVLQCCENSHFDQALSLLDEGDSRAATQGAAILRLLLKKGQVKQSAVV